MKIGRRIIAVVLALMIGLSMILAGCGGGGKIKLTMVESLTSPERTQVLREIADAYTKANPNITIEIIAPPLDGADQKIQQMLMNKDEMDIFEVRDSTVAQFTSNDFIEPLDDYIKDWEHLGTLVENTHLTAKLVGDKYYLMPYGFYLKMLFYRSDWLEEAGIPVPTTWDEIYEAGLKLTDPSKGRYGWTLRGVRGGWTFVGELTRARLGSTGIDLFDPYYTSSGKSVFGTPEAALMMDYMKKLYTDTSPKDSISWAYPDQCQAFTSGVTAFLFQDPEVVAICEESMEPGTWDTAPLPVDSVTGQFPVGVGYAGWGIPAHSTHKKEAADFILYLSDPDNNVRFCKTYSVIPIHSNAPEKDEFFKSGPFGPYAYMNNNPDKFFMTVGKSRAEDGEIDKIREVDYSQVLSGEKDAAQTLSEWTAVSDDIH